MFKIDEGYDVVMLFVVSFDDILSYFSIFCLVLFSKFFSYLFFDDFVLFTFKVSFGELSHITTHQPILINELLILPNFKNKLPT